MIFKYFVRNSVIQLIRICFLLIFSNLYSHAQKDSLILKNVAYGGFMRQGLLYVKYERDLTASKFFHTFANIGFGGLPGDGEYGMPGTKKIMPEIGGLLGYKFLWLELGVEPSINFYGNLCYVDLNGVIGLRYQNFNNLEGSPFFQVGYYPRIYQSYKSLVDVPFLMGVGMTF